MTSLQLLQLTERGRSLFSSAGRRKALLLATGIVVAGGTAAYMQSQSRVRRPNGTGQYNGLGDDSEQVDLDVGINTTTKKSRQKKGLKSLQVLAAILLSHMGKMGARDLLALVATVVLRTAVSNRLAKVQGFLFRAAFLRRVPIFVQLIIENITLCFAQSALYSTSKYITGTLSLRFRKILTKLIHAQYFQNMIYYKMSHVDGRITNPEQRIASDVPCAFVTRTGWVMAEAVHYKVRNTGGLGSLSKAVFKKARLRHARGAPEADALPQCIGHPDALHLWDAW
nr:ABC transporter D family member 1 [Tanacetum cinerariifolium]